MPAVRRLFDTHWCSVCRRRDARNRVREIDGRRLCGKHAAAALREYREGFRGAYALAATGRIPAAARAEHAEHVRELDALMAEAGAA